MTSNSLSNYYFFVGSINPIKTSSVRRATVSHWPNAVVNGYEVESGVSAQPRTDAETKLGATQRAQAALHAGLKELQTQHSDQNQDDLTAIGIGLEGGVFEQDGEMWSTVWGVVVDQKDQVFASNGARFLIPQIVAEKIYQGEEMGVASAHISGIENVKHKNGLIGIVTKDFVDRTTEYASIAKLTIGLWYGRTWQADLSAKSTR